MLRLSQVASGAHTPLPARTQLRGTVSLLAGLIYVAICSGSLSLPAQEVTFKVGVVPQEVVARRMNRLRLKDAQREAELKAMFEEAGCAADRIAEETVRPKDPPNIICTLPGTTNSLIIVSAHFDHARKGDGAVDDWSGASLLPSLYEGMKVSPRKHTFQFIGFTDEEKGLVGSGFHVKHLTEEQLSTIKAVVNLECLGLASTEVWAHVADSRLLEDLGRLSLSIHMPVKRVDVQKVGNDDTQAFRDKKIPTITIHSLTQATLPILHSRKDILGVVDVKRLNASYGLVAQYLAFLDRVLD